MRVLAELDLGSGTAPLEVSPLPGGVSSDIWKVVYTDRTVCIKQALAKLRTKANWYAPVGRNAAEANWLRWAGHAVPGSVPALLAEDRDAGLLVMEYLAPERYPLWKAELMAGRVDSAFAGRVGDTLGRLHAAAAADPAVPAGFPNAATFHDIRVEPYLLHPLERNRDLHAPLQAIAGDLAGRALTLIHGDASPKNLLRSPGGAPVLLDAECATAGDPAFDLAFCLNHLLLKGRLFPARGSALLASAATLRETYLRHVAWEEPAALETRVARLLPGLMLGRVDGRSPVEYLDTEPLQSPVRTFAREHLMRPVAALPALFGRWARLLESLDA
ncbi:MAG: phosphotransferase [Rhodospirillales bacterium]|nr:phosphotransferase [Rhodospirillales bacterium]